MKKSTSERLKKIMNVRGLKQIDIVNLAQPFCKKYNIKLGRNDLSQYISGKVEPTQNKLFILSKALDVNVSWLMGLNVPMHSNSTIQKCPICDFVYSPCNKEDVDTHNHRHLLCLDAIKKYGFWWSSEQCEKIKSDAHLILDNPLASNTDKMNAAENICKAYFCRCLGAWNFDPRHPSIEKYTAMLLHQNHFKEYFSSVYTQLIDKYGISEGIPEGNTYITDEKFLEKAINKANIKSEIEILYNKLDNEDKAEIRGTIKGMLKSNKYKHSSNIVEDMTK